MTIFQDFRLVALEDPPNLVWTDYISLFGGLEREEAAEMLRLLRDPEFEFTPDNCDESWLRADKRLVREAAEYVAEGAVPEVISGRGVLMPHDVFEAVQSIVGYATHREQQSWEQAGRPDDHVWHLYQRVGHFLDAHAASESAY